MMTPQAVALLFVLSAAPGCGLHVHDVGLQTLVAALRDALPPSEALHEAMQDLAGSFAAIENATTPEMAKFTRLAVTKTSFCNEMLAFSSTNPHTFISMGGYALSLD